MQAQAESRIRARGRRSREAGLSLLEVVLTMALLTSMALGTSLLVIPIARQSRVGREIQAANTAARDVLEKIQATPFKDILTTYPHSSEHTVPSLENGAVRVLYDDPAADPLLVRAEVSWSSPDFGNMTRTFHTVRTE